MNVYIEPGWEIVSKDEVSNTTPKLNLVKPARRKYGLCFIFAEKFYLYEYLVDSFEDLFEGLDHHVRLVDMRRYNETDFDLIDIDRDNFILVEIVEIEGKYHLDEKVRLSQACIDFEVVKGLDAAFLRILEYYENVKPIFDEIHNLLGNRGNRYGEF
jgi:hypothetical protein